MPKIRSSPARPGHTRDYTLQPVSGGEAKLITRKDRHVVSFALSPDSTRAAYAAQPTPANRDSFNVDLVRDRPASPARERELVVQPGRDADPSIRPMAGLSASTRRRDRRTISKLVMSRSFPAAAAPFATLQREHAFDVFRGGNVLRWIRFRTLDLYSRARTYRFLVKHDLKTGKTEVLAENIAGTASFPLRRRRRLPENEHRRPPEYSFATETANGRLTNLQAGVAELPTRPLRARQMEIQRRTADRRRLWLP